MSQSTKSAKGYVAGGIAFITCPCHLVFTVPILIGLTAGTAFGTWLQGNVVTFGVSTTVIFVAGAALAYRWLRSQKEDEKKDCYGSTRIEEPRT